jgi:low affinity Fe/Cu permease
MVFLLQNTQNRDSQVLQIKLDELIRAHEGAHNSLINIEDLTEEEIRALKKKYIALAKLSQDNIPKGIPDTQMTEI